jgi:hypothetical protein
MCFSGKYDMVHWLVGNNIGGKAWIGVCDMPIAYRVGLSGLASYVISSSLL